MQEATYRKESKPSHLGRGLCPSGAARPAGRRLDGCAAAQTGRSRLGCRTGSGFRDAIAGRPSRSHRTRLCRRSLRPKRSPICSACKRNGTSRISNPLSRMPPHSIFRASRSTPLWSPWCCIIPTTVRIMRNVARLLKPNGLAVIAEFHPDGPCEHGPPRDHRLTFEQVRT